MICSFTCFFRRLLWNITSNERVTLRGKQRRDGCHVPFVPGSNIFPLGLVSESWGIILDEYCWCDFFWTWVSSRVEAFLHISWNDPCMAHWSASWQLLWLKFKGTIKTIGHRRWTWTQIAPFWPAAWCCFHMMNQSCSHIVISMSLCPRESPSLPWLQNVFLTTTVAAAVANEMAKTTQRECGWFTFSLCHFQLVCLLD